MGALKLDSPICILKVSSWISGYVSDAQALAYLQTCKLNFQFSYLMTFQFGSLINTLRQTEPTKGLLPRMRSSLMPSHKADLITPLVNNCVSSGSAILKSS